MLMVIHPTIEVLLYPLDDHFLGYPWPLIHTHGAYQNRWRHLQSQSRWLRREVPRDRLMRFNSRWGLVLKHAEPWGISLRTIGMFNWLNFNLETKISSTWFNLNKWDLRNNKSWFYLQRWWKIAPSIQWGTKYGVSEYPTRCCVKLCLSNKRWSKQQKGNATFPAQGSDRWFDDGIHSEVLSGLGPSSQRTEIAVGITFQGERLNFHKLSAISLQNNVVNMTEELDSFIRNGCESSQSDTLGFFLCRWLWPSRRMWLGL